LAKDLLPRRWLEVEGQAALVAVHGHEVGRFTAKEGRPAASVVAPSGLLQLDHVGAHVAQHHGAERPGQDAGEVENTDAGQGGLSARHAAFLSTCAWRGCARWR